MEATTNQEQLLLWHLRMMERLEEKITTETLSNIVHLPGRVPAQIWKAAIVAFKALARRHLKEDFDRFSLPRFQDLDEKLEVRATPILMETDGSSWRQFVCFSTADQHLIVSVEMEGFDFVPPKITWDIKSLVVQDTDKVGANRLQVCERFSLTQLSSDSRLSVCAEAM